MQNSKIWKSAMKQNPMSPEICQPRGRGACVDHSTAAKKSGSRSPTRGCMCAPTTHPGSFRCRYHRSIGIVRWQPAEAKKPVVEAKVLSSPSIPPTIEKHRRAVGASRLSRVTFADSTSETAVEEDSGPLRFLKQVARDVGNAVGETTDSKPHGDRALANPGAAKAAPSCRNGQYHNVKKRDTLSTIARQCGSSITILSTVNNLKSDVIYPEQKLWIPVTYEIQKGDSLFQVSRRFKTTIGDIMKMNMIKDPNSIQAGDIILLP